MACFHRESKPACVQGAAQAVDPESCVRDVGQFPPEHNKRTQRTAADARQI